MYNYVFWNNPSFLSCTVKFVFFAQHCLLPLILDGFRKITSITQSGVNPEKEEIEFYHYMFVRGENHLLEHIKRKVGTVPENI